MNGPEFERSYEHLYSQLLDKAESLHASNKRRIRRGLIGLVVLPVVLGFVRWVTDSNRIVFLIVWVLAMFILCAYLITVEYLDDSILKTMNDVGDQELEFDELLMTPELLQGRIRERIDARRAMRAAAAVAAEEENPDDLPDTVPFDEPGEEEEGES